MPCRRSDADIKLVIDDSDTSVTYFGDWRNRRDDANYFNAYDLTMHSAYQPNAKASISFNGSYITVFGIIPSLYDLKHGNLSTAGQELRSSYQFDDEPLVYFNTTFNDSQHFTNQAFFQSNTTQSEGHHKLVITCLVGIIGLDYFTIVPATSGSTNIQKIDDTSPSITYNVANPVSNTQTSDFNSTLHNLSSPQSTAVLNFNGNFAAVYGALPSGDSLPNVSFTLDNGSGQSNSIPSLPTNRTHWLSQVLFWESPNLNDGQHNLSITATEGEFLLDFILIQTLDNAPMATGTSLAGASACGSSTSSGSVPRSSTFAGVTSPNHTRNTSVIVGGAVGGAVGFVVLLLVLYMIRILSRRMSNLRSTAQSDLSPQFRVQAPLPPATTILTAGIPCLADGSSPVVVGYILAPSMDSTPPPYQPRDEIHERQVVPTETDGGKDIVLEAQYGHDDKFAQFGQVLS